MRALLTIVSSVALSAVTHFVMSNRPAVFRYQGNTPTRSHVTDAGFDIRATDTIELAPGQRYLMGTGTRIDTPPGYYISAVPRSGLAHKHGLSIVNTPGTVDAGYQGEIKINLINHGAEPVRILAGERIAQLVVHKTTPVIFARGEFNNSERGENGHGSTGRK